MDEDNVESAPWTKTNTEVEEFILWRKDKAPDAQDPRINAIHNWIDISQAVNTWHNDNMIIFHLILLFRYIPRFLYLLLLHHLHHRRQYHFLHLKYTLSIVRIVQQFYFLSK